VRRPTGPTQRTPQAPAPRAAETAPERAPRRPASAAPAAVASEPDAQLTEPIDINGRIAAVLREAGSEPETEPAGARAPKAERSAAADADAGGAGFVSRFESWRTVRRARSEAVRVVRGEARRFTARTRRRRQIQLACAGFVVLVIGGAIVTAYSPFMSLKTIDVEGAHSVKAADVRSALSDELGKPLPLVKSADIRRALDDFRLIESYSTQLEPPSTLVVRITERTPIAVVKQGSSFELVDQAGVVLAAGATAQAGYPVVTLKAGEQPDASAGFAAAASVLAALPTGIRSQVTAATATSPNAVTLALTGGKSVVWGGTDQTQLKTQDLQALLKGAPGVHVYDVSSPKAPITR
jgi:cell division protein FtsQ